MGDPFSHYYADLATRHEFRLMHLRDVIGSRFHPAKESWNKLDNLFSNASQVAKKIRDGESPALALSAFSHANGLSLDESKKLLEISNILERSEFERLRKEYIKKARATDKAKFKEAKKARAAPRFKLHIIHK